MYRLINEQIEALRDAAANAAGFNIASIALTGEKQVSREDVLTAAGITGRTSLLFLDADSARRKLKANPWISEATVLKLYPDRLQIGITERQAFALWQKNGQLSVIAEDGTVSGALCRAPLHRPAAGSGARGARTREGYSGAD